ncbi:uncharacterized protein BX663DRAFT_521573 [Cokeromyces recurvatus]|uniref:uncharacterized protein n=1 Tax=Cokeromyces recurvatus TaxID=90255 RepID=UPI0022210CC1|nr:uncharacterized protein BX663DRAFT_521573 [Cokeromyces recurvatus]KAI7899384.1 hypothetical protein BX663DRAFT_521573 [Cokeromyces recurvatus]
MKEENSPVLLLTLDDVLHRKSQPPVCLYNFYIVLKDRLGLEILLDFWLDVTQANLLYKRYIKSSSRKEMESALLLTTAPSLLQQNSNDHLLTTLLLLSDSCRPVFISKKPRPPPPTQREMIETLEGIYLRYIVPNAEKEIEQLPYSIKEAIRLHFHQLSPEDPIIYDQAKDYVYQLLASTFPLFLRYKLWMNLTLPQQVARLFSGLFCLCIGFSFEFSFIFLDIQPWQKRLWGILPIISGVFCIITSMIGIDPIWVLIFNTSETIPFHFNQIIEPKAKNILRKRSLHVLGIILLITFIIMAFFCTIAGKRL